MNNKQPRPHEKQAAVTAAVTSVASADATVQVPDRQTLQQTLMDSLDVMQLLRICRGTLYNWRKQGMISCSKVGGRVYFEAADVYRMLKERKQPKFTAAA